MNCYIITYDLRQPGRNYEALYEAIQSYGTWAHINQSTWAVVTTQSAVQIRDFLLNSMDANDSIFVVKSGTEAAWQNVICRHNWLQERL